MRTTLSLPAIGLLLAGATASAHHSATGIDMQKTASLHGVVRDFKWINPHVWLYVTVAAEDGSAQDVAIEGPPVMALAQRGVRKSDLKPGDRIEVVYHPHRDGKPGGQLDHVIHSGTGLVVTMGGPATPAAASSAAPPAN